MEESGDSLKLVLESNTKEEEEWGGSNAVPGETGEPKEDVGDINALLVSSGDSMDESGYQREEPVPDRRVMKDGGQVRQRPVSSSEDEEDSAAGERGADVLASSNEGDGDPDHKTRIPELASEGHRNGLCRRRTAKAKVKVSVTVDKKKPARKTIYCGSCKGCRILMDCGKCTMCRKKPKFGAVGSGQQAGQ